MTEQTKMGPPPWSEAPGWAEWLAMVSNGEWRWFKVKPDDTPGGWDATDGFSLPQYDFKGDRLNRHWTETLEPRHRELEEDDWEDHISPCAMHSYEDESPHDPVSRPSHYTAGGIECIDAIRAALTDEEFRGFVKGNAIKYTWRERMKGGDEDLRKADWYLNKLNENEEKQ